MRFLFQMMLLAAVYQCLLGRWRSIELSPFWRVFPKGNPETLRSYITSGFLAALCVIVLI
jgi:hypothetical protein